MESCLTWLLVVYVTLPLCDYGHFPLEEKGGPYLWWVNTELLFITTAAQ